MTAIKPFERHYNRHRATRVRAEVSSLSNVQAKANSPLFTNRRVLLQGIALNGLVLFGPSKSLAEAAPQPFLSSSSNDNISTFDDDPAWALEASTNPGLSWTIQKKQKQLFYPDWFQGTWKCDSRFVSVSFPQGQRFINKTVPGILKGSIIAAVADVGAASDKDVSFQQKFEISMEQGGVVSDRIYNIQQEVDAYLSYSAVRRVDYDPLDNPTRLAVVWATPRRDTSLGSEDLRKAELFINNREGREQLDKQGRKVFLGRELYRQVTQAAKQGSVGDYMVSSLYTQMDTGRIRVRQRVASFLQPQDTLFFDAHNQAVAIYDHSQEMTLL